MDFVCLTLKLFPSGRPSNYGLGKVTRRPPPLWMPLCFLASGWWTSQPQPRTQGEGTSRPGQPQDEGCFLYKLLWLPGPGILLCLLSETAWLHSIPLRLLFGGPEIPVLMGPPLSPESYLGKSEGLSGH